MKVWKSPVFYFGIILALTVLSAMLVPLFVDWGSYRGALQAYGEKLTGRKVEIAGPIGVRLFPWPRLTAGDVRIENPAGAPEKWFATADKIVVRMTLGALLNGTIQVEGIDIEKPVVKLRRPLDGVGNWNFEPAESFRNNRLLEHVMLDQIRITSGTLELVDDRRGDHVDLDDFNATFSAPNLAGPWRTSGTFSYDELPLTFSASTGAWAKDAPLGLALRISSASGAGYSYALEGVDTAGKFAGTVSLEPIVNDEGKGDTEGQFRPVTFKSKVAADFNKVDLSDIEIRPADVKDQGTLLAGSASFTLDKLIKVDADISAPRVDFDSLAGAGSRQLLRDGGGLALVNGLLTMLPEAVDVRSSIKVSALKAGGETLENVLLDVALNRDAIRIHELSASLPGRSRALFNGVFFPGEQYAELGGDLAVESQDARQLSLWIWPESKEDILKTWTGSRGRLKAKTAISLTASRLNLQNIEYELDGEQGKANLAILVNGERPIIDLRVDTKIADIDSFVPDGFAGLSSQGESSWLLFLAKFVDEQVKRDLRFAFQAGTVRLNGVEANDVAVDVETTVKGFDLKTLEIGLVNGAKLSASGVVLNTPNGPDGTVGIAITAEDPRELLRLSGLMPKDKDPLWSAALGKTDVKIKLEDKPSAEEPATNFSINGQVGELAISSQGQLFPQADLKGVDINGSAEITSASSAALFKIFGGPSDAVDTIPSRLVLIFDGARDDNFIVDLKADAYRSSLHFAGKVKPGDMNFGINGDLTIDSDDSQDLLATLKIPAGVPPGGKLSFASKLSAAASTITFDDIEARLANASWSGTAALEGGQKVTGDFTVDRVSLTDVLAPVFLPWNGGSAGFDQPFAAGQPYGLTGEVWIRPKSLTIYPGLDVGDAQIGITASDGKVQVVAYAKNPDGSKVTVELAAAAAAGGKKLTGQLALPIDVARSLKLADGAEIATGQAAIDLRFAAEGRSPASALATLNATGTFKLADGKLLDLSPENFAKNVVVAKDEAGLRAAFASLHAGDGISLEPVLGTLFIDHGVVTVAPFGKSTADADVQIKPVAELMDGQFDMGVTLSFKAMPNLPPMEIAYSGPPLQLVAQEDTVALTSFLGFKALEQGVVDLEKAQAEQQRLAVEEEKMRIEDQARLDAFYAQKAELRLRLRELRVHANQQVLDAELAKVELARLIKTGEDINRTELRQRLRELRFYRKLAEALKPVPAPTPPEKPVTPEPYTQVPLILVPPASPSP